jgi:hypothetical protein
MHIQTWKSIKKWAQETLTSSDWAEPVATANHVQWARGRIVRDMKMIFFPLYCSHECQWPLSRPMSQLSRIGLQEFSLTRIASQFELATRWPYLTNQEGSEGRTWNSIRKTFVDNSASIDRYILLIIFWDMVMGACEPRAGRQRV